MGYGTRSVFHVALLLLAVVGIAQSAALKAAGGSGRRMFRRGVSVRGRPELGVRKAGQPANCYDVKPTEHMSAIPYALNNTLWFKEPKGSRVVPAKKSWQTFYRNMTWLNRAWCPPTDKHVAVSCQSAPTVKRELEKAEVVDVDLFDVDEATIKSYKDAGKIVACYISVGTIEDWRADVKADPTSWKKVAGNPMGSWPGETWIDVRKLSELAPLMENRIQLARRKGCDALEPDNMDCWLADSVQEVTCDGGMAQACSPDIVTYDPKDSSTFEFREAQIAYLRWLADAAHRNNLAIGFKNNFLLAEELEEMFDFAVAEGAYDALACFQPFVETGKPVFVHDYMVTPTRFSNESVASSVSQEEYCRLSEKSTEWLWEDDGGQAFCMLCYQVDSMGFGDALVRAQWEKDTWVNCGDYADFCEKKSPNVIARMLRGPSGVDMSRRRDGEVTVSSVIAARR